MEMKAYEDKEEQKNQGLSISCLEVAKLLQSHFSPHEMTPHPFPFLV
jgi:hypothetical protein